MPTPLPLPLLSTSNTHRLLSPRACTVSFRMAMIAPPEGAFDDPNPHPDPNPNHNPNPELELSVPLFKLEVGVAPSSNGLQCAIQVGWAAGVGLGLGVGWAAGVGLGLGLGWAAGAGWAAGVVLCHTNVLYSNPNRPTPNPSYTPPP